MNILMNSDGYHFTMGYLIGEDAMQNESHILYARSGGPLVVPNLSEIAAQYAQWRPTKADVREADDYWTSRGVPFFKEAWEQIADMPSMPIVIRGVRDGEVVMPGEPIAIVEAPAIMAAVPEPYFISRLMKSAQLATRFTKVARALDWERDRAFEVGMRAGNSVDDHKESVKVLASMGLSMTSSGIAGMEAGIASGGSMGHRFTQRFDSDYAAFNQAIDRMLKFRSDKGINGRVKLSLLLDTRSTLESGLPAAIKVIKNRISEIRGKLDISVRLDSGDLDQQLRVVINTFQNELKGLKYLPAIIMESGLTPEDIAGFEAVAKSMGFPRDKMLYGVGGYLVGAISRDFVSMVYKVSSYGGAPTMKFSDEVGGGKESYPGKVVLMERKSTLGIERQLVQVVEVSQMEAQGWRDIFIDIVTNGERVAPETTKDERISRVESRWEMLAEGYIGNEKRPAQFPVRPQMSQGMIRMIDKMRQQQFVTSTNVAKRYNGSTGGVL